ncbi:MAG: poly(R)-hydroxyalkanoic acid synthase subunit PhaE [Desulfomonilia bacterium]
MSQDALMRILKTWGTLSSALAEPSAVDSMARTMTLLPDFVMKFFHTTFESYMKLQEQMLSRVTNLGTKSEAYRFDNIDQDSLKAWSDFYKQEIRQYLNVPQLGLMRFYQERMNQTFDKFNIFSTTFAEFLQVIFLPFEKSMKVLQDKIDHLISEGSLPDDPHEVYRMWIKILEGHFMTLFKSPEYTKALGDTLNSLEDFLSSRNRIMQDTLQSLPIPSNKDMDDLYHELYLLKKRVKELEKKNSKH